VNCQSLGEYFFTHTDWSLRVVRMQRGPVTIALEAPLFLTLQI